MSRYLWLGAAALQVALVWSAGAQNINGVMINQRVFNDYPDSTLTVTNNYPSLVTIRDQFPTTPAGKFANRHDALFSTDGGATAATFNNNESFDVSADVTLTDGSNAPRKEAGIRVNSSVGGDGLLLVNSDAGEIVAFGGPLPFFIFGKNATGNGYTPGQLINLRMIYDANAHTVEYQVKEGTSAVQTSGPLAFSNLENGVIDGSNVGLYGQFSPAAPGDFGAVTFGKISASLVPEPACVAGLGAFAVALLARRRTTAAAV
jgi:hypothetical protein